MIDFSIQRYALLALASAALFGAAAPALKPIASAHNAVLLAAMLFRELVASRIWIAAVLIWVAAAFLAWTPRRLNPGVAPRARGTRGLPAMGLDNNRTGRIALADPYAIAMWKGLAAGGVNTTIGLALAPAVPDFSWLGALCVGAVGYGASLVLYVLALRHLGAARTAAHFGTAPFFGAVLAIAMLGEPVTWSLAAAFALTAAGTWLVLTEQQGHEHEHEAMDHEHRHVHDAHHQHVHGADEGPEPHSHPHRHAPMRHRHAHFPDLHHRHPH